MEKRNKVIVLSLLILTTSSFGQLNKKKEVRPQETEEYLKLKQQIEAELSEEVLEKHKKARQLFQKARVEAANATQNIVSKLNELQKKINDGKEVSSINKKLLVDAQKKHDQAKIYIGEYKYVEALTTIEEGLKLIMTIPVVSLTIEPESFSPDGDGSDDELMVKTKVFSHTNIVEWKIAFSQPIGLGKKKQYVVVKEENGEGAPPALYKWDGFLEDGKTRVDSANTYTVQVTVKDADDGIGQSVHTFFKTDIFVTKHKRGLMIDISAIHFAYNSAKIKRQYMPVLNQLYDKLSEYPDYVIAVEGHTDATGTASYNKKLSGRRAASVLKFLVEKGIEPKMIKSVGVGEILPKTLDAQKIDINRRVNFFLLKTAAQVKAYDRFINKLNFNHEVKMIK